MCLILSDTSRQFTLVINFPIPIHSSCRCWTVVIMHTLSALWEGLLRPKNTPNSGSGSGPLPLCLSWSAFHTLSDKGNNAYVRCFKNSSPKEIVRSKVNPTLWSNKYFLKSLYKISFPVIVPRARTRGKYIYPAEFRAIIVTDRSWRGWRFSTRRLHLNVNLFVGT
jgi:hypothetical protein